ncbi:16S rRNA (guanine(527)-N(7))-methyltransferase RsmG [Lachnobacterium bovis]|uniref:Ribosomal RNA small subunit methyltransferase G n=1 Tax=Lachnobacterium bovis TaxID=140626 RepID=A0A1H9UDD4_9FIRM|nr:16S rRNA (guanine(527)-N(7))-methyltransferase RsmG [Lachnobacterium bovis]SES07177.1 16S rRNA (guanine527-N7)-methyltransferase [Lachnobacterium bovis]
MKYNFDKLYEFAKQYEIELNENKINQLTEFYELLVEKNKVMNLTGITEFEEVLTKHFIDSISLIQVLNLNQEIKILDLGTGAGFPGIPLKIVFPEIDICLADSLNKRILFLDEVIEKLNLKKIETVHARAEDLAMNKKFREQFDVVVSRAVANLSTLSEYCIPFVKIGGKFISYKSGNVSDEVEASKSAVFLLGGKIVDVHNFIIDDNNRSFIIIEKKQGTSKKYPRKAGTPSKKPL